MKHANKDKRHSAVQCSAVLTGIGLDWEDPAPWTVPNLDIPFTNTLAKHGLSQTAITNTVYVL